MSRTYERRDAFFCSGLDACSEPANELLAGSVLRRRQLRDTEEVEEEAQAEQQRVREPILRSSDEASEKALQVRKCRCPVPSRRLASRLRLATSIA